jgi:endoglucanase
MIDFKFLSKIVETPGTSGFESRIRQVIIDAVEPVVDSVNIDNLGNVVAFRKGKNDKKVMIGAHMDEIGFIVNHIDDDGFIRFLPLGGFDPKTLTSQRVIVHGKKDIIGVMGTKPIHLMKPEERKKGIELSDFFIDVGMPKEEVEEIVSIGNPVTRERSLIELGHLINGKSLDNRISVYILIEVLQHLKGKELPFDLYAVFTAQEEVGIRGAQVSALEINPDFGFGLDTTIAFDTPGAEAHNRVTKLGEGVAIKIMDSSAIADIRMVDYLKQIADKYDIKWQAELLPAGGTDTANIQRMNKSGSIAGAISIPTRYIHSVIETESKNDIVAAIKLLEKALLELDTFQWKYR